MKRFHQITVVTIVALAFVGISRHAVQAGISASAPATNITQIVTGGPTPKQAAELSEQGLAAVNQVHLARLAINDGYVDSAKKLLADARKQLDQVRKEDRPVTVTTDVKVANQPVQHERTQEQLDLIPILSELEVVEGFVTPEANATPPADQTAAVKAQPTATTAKTGNADTATDQAKAKDTAIAQAKEHLRQGDRQAAAQALKLADLTLVSRVLSLPLAQTNAHVNTAIQLVEQGKLHEANLELKAIQDGLVITTAVVDEPITDAQPATNTSHG